MSPIRSFTALALALGAAAAPAAVELPKLDVSAGPIHVSADALTSSILPAAGTQLRREAALGELPNPPAANLPSFEPPNFNLPKVPSADPPALPEIPQIKPEAPTVSPISFKPEPVQASVKDIKVPRVIAPTGLPVQLNTESIAVSFSTPVAVPGIVVPELQPRETALPIDAAQIDAPRGPLPTVSVKQFSASIPAVSVTIPSVADINPGVPKLPRRNIKLPAEVASPAVDLPALSSVLSMLGALVTTSATQPEARDVVVALPAVTSIVSVLGDVKAALPRDDKFAAVSSVVSVLGEVKASLLPRNPLVESPIKVEAASTTVDMAALNTVIAVLNKLASPEVRRDALVPGAELPSVTVDLPIVSSALSVLGSVASAGLSVKAARDLPVPNVLSTGVAIGAGVNVLPFTVTVPIPGAPVLGRATLELPLTTLIPVLSVSKSLDILARDTIELPLTTLVPVLSKPVDLLARNTIELPLTTLVPVLSVSKSLDILARDTIELPLTTLVPTLSKPVDLLARNTIELPLTTLVPTLSKPVELLARDTIELPLTTLVPVLSKPVDLLARDTIELSFTTLVPTLSKPIDLLARDTIELPLTTLVPTLSKPIELLPRDTLELPLTTLVPALSKSVDIVPRATIELPLTTQSLSILPAETKIPELPTVPQ
ncbi:hypothetical protein CkaCkLH20_08000 [Colletotrichum karsti]|uniref:Zonadhesin n=1 Tax=Colletotrichum karsti TaxID=1095194 RepID=A0A9P6HZY0_9PEZI|nr:uncharacterized protein CkaCkLH20_08000 [Colletotrichum karsti]KAF9874437.1 hypothetical protein CkaCkLH20_08000 [Colletotrichum karsti]